MSILTYNIVLRILNAYNLFFLVCLITIFFQEIFSGNIFVKWCFLDFQCLQHFFPEPDTIVISGMVDIDYLAYISSSSKIEEIFDCLSSGIWKQLHQTYCYAADRFSNGLRLNVLPKRFHFKPRCLGHFVSTVAIDGEPEKNRGDILYLLYFFCNRAKMS